MEQYQAEYSDFIKNYQSGITTAEQVGFLVAKMAQYFSTANEVRGFAEKSKNRKLFDCEQEVDVNSKPLSSAKAQAKAAASEEYAQFITADLHLENINQLINALKTLQKGVLNEYAHMGST